MKRMFVNGKFSILYCINTEKKSQGLPGSLLAHRQFSSPIRLASGGATWYTSVMTSTPTKEVTGLNAQDRRDAIARELERSPAPLSATALAKQFSVSRQVIVGDIALLRAAGADITATPRGYIIPRSAAGLKRTLACRHGGDRMETELNAMVDQGCTVLDVIVEHPIYGQLTGPLNLSSRYDVSQFICRAQQHAAPPLSQLTEGIHLHTVLCPDQAAFDRVRQALRQLDILLEE